MKMKKNLFYFLIPIIFITTGFYYLNHAQHEDDTTIKKKSNTISPVELLPIDSYFEPLNEEKKLNQIPIVSPNINKNENEKKAIKKPSTRLYPFFSPKDNIREILIEYIKKEEKSICCAIFRLTDPLIAHELLRAHERGIKLTLVIDKEGFSAIYSKLLYLFSKNISVYIYPPIVFDIEKTQKKEGLMHNKFICLESKEIVITGSFNYTKSAQDINQENILVVEDPDTYKTYLNHFNYLKTISSPLELKDIKNNEMKKTKKRIKK